MKLTEAIEILTVNALEPGSYLPPDYIDAVKLGIEALKRQKDWKARVSAHVYEPLPGETEE